MFDRAGVREALRHFDSARLGPVLDRVEAALADLESRVVLVTGSPGSGKTTLLAALADRHLGWARYFIRPGQDGGLWSFLVAIGTQMACVAPPVGGDAPITFTVRMRAGEVAEGGNVTGGRFGEVVSNPFDRCQAFDIEVTTGIVRGQADGMVGRFLTADDYPAEALADFALFDPARRMPGRTVVLIDGVDRLPASGPGNDLLRWLSDSEAPPANVRFVVAGRGDFGRLRTLREGHRRTLCEIELGSPLPGGTQVLVEPVAGGAGIEAHGDLSLAEGSQEFQV